MTPLVQRLSLQGNFFIEDTEPPNWLDGDLWADTSESPPILNLNDNGTAVAVGVVELDTTGLTQTERRAESNSIALKSDIGPPTSFTTVSSKAITVAKDDSLVVLVGYATYGTDRAAGITISGKILDVAVEVVSEVTLGLIQNDCKTIIVKGVITGVSSGVHTYNMQSKTNVTASGTESLFSTGIFASVIT